MNFFVLGVNHKTAPVAVRERFALSKERAAEALRRLTARADVSEALLIATCNRTEILACGVDEHCNLRAFVHEFFGLQDFADERWLFDCHGREAVRHVFRLASSLDSMVVGEAQILGQLKQAYAAARAQGAVRAQLDHLLTRAFAAAKKVRRQTRIAASAVSVASVAVELAGKIFGSLNDKAVFLVGAGPMCELAARHFLAHGAKKIYVANRTYARAVALAAKFNGEAVAFERLYEAVPRADIVLSSTGAPQAIFRREHGAQFLRARRNRPMFFIDIAMPRDVAPEVNELEGIFVYNLDDLQQVAATHLGGRRQEAARAELIVAEEVRRFEQRLRTAQVVPTIVGLQQQLEAVRQAELARVRGRLGRLTAEQEMAIETLTRGIVNKILHVPITALKAATGSANSAAPVVEAVSQLFNLSPENGATSDADVMSSDAAGMVEPQK